MFGVWRKLQELIEWATVRHGLKIWNLVFNIVPNLEIARKRLNFEFS